MVILVCMDAAAARWTSLAPWEFEFPFPGSLTSTFLAGMRMQSGSRIVTKRASLQDWYSSTLRVQGLKVRVQGLKIEVLGLRRF